MESTAAKILFFGRPPKNQNSHVDKNDRHPVDVVLKINPGA